MILTKLCRSLEFSKGETFCTEKLIVAKKRLKNLCELLDARDLHIFEISVKFHSF